MAPVVHGLEIEYWGEVDFAFIDVDDPNNAAYKESYGFRGQPYFVFLGRDGHVVQSLYGRQREELLRGELEELLSSS